MRKGKIKNSIVTIAMAMMLSVTAVVGFGTNAKAAAGNTGNKQYSYSNIDPIGSCEWRTKNNATKVYVYPTAGPKIYYEANGRKKNSITGQYEKFAGSYSYAIPTMPSKHPLINFLRFFILPHIPFIGGNNSPSFPLFSIFLLAKNSVIPC